MTTETKVKMPHGSPITVLQYVIRWASEANRSQARSRAAIGNLATLLNDTETQLTPNEKYLVSKTIDAIQCAAA